MTSELLVPGSACVWKGPLHLGESSGEGPEQLGRRAWRSEPGGSAAQRARQGGRPPTAPAPVAPGRGGARVWPPFRPHRYGQTEGGKEEVGKQGCPGRGAGMGSKETGRREPWSGGCNLRASVADRGTTWERQDGGRENLFPPPDIGHIWSPQAPPRTRGWAFGGFRHRKNKVLTLRNSLTAFP